MFSFIGIIVVLAAVAGGYLMEQGNLLVLMQPAELLIIGGAAAGTLLIANPAHVLKSIGSGVVRAFGKSPYGKNRYIATFKMFYDLLGKMRRAGALAVEADIESPAESLIFQAYPVFLKDHHALAFVCDTMRMVVTGGVDTFAMDQMMELDMEVQQQSAHQPIHALNTAADALPGFGIVAAVLGVVITMGALGGPAEQIGHKVAAALVGTFLGILLCYGFFGPLSSNMAKSAEEEHAYLHVLRVVLAASMRESVPVLAVEIGRRAVPVHVRPSFEEVEAACHAQATSGADVGAPDMAAATEAAISAEAVAG